MFDGPLTCASQHSLRFIRDALRVDLRLKPTLNRKKPIDNSSRQYILRDDLISSALSREFGRTLTAYQALTNTRMVRPVDRSTCGRLDKSLRGMLRSFCNVNNVKQKRIYLPSAHILLQVASLPWLILSQIKSTRGTNWRSWETTEQLMLGEM